MSVSLETKPVYRLSETELARCKKLTFFNDKLRAGNGEMYKELLRQLKKGSKSTARAIMLRKGKEIVGWALIWQPNPKSPIKRWDFYMYVHRSHRRHGYGTMLLKRARVGRPGRIYVYPHDYVSRQVYESKCDQKRIYNAW